MQIEIQSLLDNLVADSQRMATGLDRLSRYTNENISKLQREIVVISKDLEALRDQECPRDKVSMNEFLENERLKRKEKEELEVVRIIKQQKLLSAADAPRKWKERIVWIVAILSSLMTLILGLDKLLN